MNRTYIILFITSLLVFIFATTLFAQGAAINATGAAADTSAMLDVTSTSKGMLVPRMLGSQRAAIILPATGLIVYQTDAPAGFYYNAGNATTPNWVLLIAGSVAGTPNDVPNALVQRDAAGGFAAGTITSDSNIVLSSTTSATRGQIRQGANRLMHTFGSNNFFAGPNAGNFTMTGGYNSATGPSALFFNTTGSNNTANGLASLYSNTSGSNNTAGGMNALSYNTTGIRNTASGGYSLYTNTTGSNNTAVGYMADVSSANLTNATALGYNAKVGTSNSLVLGGTGADAVKVGIGTTTPQGALDVVSTTGGFIVPRMTTAQRNALTAVKGMIVYDTTLDSFYKFGGAGAGAWTAF